MQARKKNDTDKIYGFSDCSWSHDAGFGVTGQLRRDEKMVDSELLSQHCRTSARFKEDVPLEHNCDFSHESSATSIATDLTKI